MTAGTGEYSYDPNGNLTNSAEGTCSWDYDNRLIATPSVQYLYDASGARVGRIAGVSPAVTNCFVVDYADPLKRPLAETDSTGNVTRYYVWAGFRLLAHIEANGTVRYYHGDELGSTLALTDGAGAVTDQFAYSPYGELLSRTGTNNTAFQWLGGYGVYYDASADLHLTLHRAYSAEQKRFISTDPMGIDGGVNLYAYGNLNPLAFVDPYGLCADSGYQAPSWENYTPGLSSPRTMNSAQYEANATLTLGAGFRPDSPFANTMADINANLYVAALDSYIGAARVATRAVATTINPATVRFSQSSISRNFSSGGTVDDLAGTLRSGTTRASDVPAIRLVERDGQLFSLDNRRLEAFRRAEVEMPYRMATPEDVAAEAWKFTTQNGGVSIRVRGQ